MIMSNKLCNIVVGISGTLCTHHLKGYYNGQSSSYTFHTIPYEEL